MTVAAELDHKGPWDMRIQACGVEATFKWPTLSKAIEWGQNADQQWAFPNPLRLLMCEAIARFALDEGIALPDNWVSPFPPDKEKKS